MALEIMGGAGGSWDANGAGGSWANKEEEKKKGERLRNTNSVLGMSGLGQIANEAAARNQAQQEIRTPYNSTPESRASNAKQLKGMGINPANPYVTGAPKPEPTNNSPKVYAGKQSDVEPTDEQVPIADTYVQEAPKLGFNPASASNNTPPPSQPGLGFRAPNAPTGRTTSEREQYEALMKQATTVQGKAQGITAAQMNVQAALQSNSDKYKNDQYQAQLGAASQLTQAQMTQDGATSRAVLGERGTNDRFNSQLGFDAGEFQQTAAAEQQRTALDTRRLDMQQANDDVANFAPKQLNALSEKYDAAQSDEDRSAIASQIQALKGTANDKEYWTNIGGGETAATDGSLTPTTNPDALLNRNTGEVRQQPAIEIDFETDERAQAIINNTSLTKEDREKQLNALR